MAQERITLNKIDFDNVQFQRAINTQFSQVIPTSTPPPINPIITLSDFFNAYNSLFYQIPKQGTNNSHEFIIKKSTDYIGAQQTNNQIQALIAEVTTLRLNNLDANKEKIENLALKAENEALKAQISALESKINK